MNNPDLKINVIKKNEIAKDIEDVKEPCKRKRVKMKDGKLDQVAIEHNKKCEKQKILGGIQTCILLVSRSDAPDH